MTDTPPLLDCDVLVGHDVTTGRWGRAQTVQEVATKGGRPRWCIENEGFNRMIRMERIQEQR